MKKAFLYAYDRQNLGDDLFVHTIAKRDPSIYGPLLRNKIVLAIPSQRKEYLKS